MTFRPKCSVFEALSYFIALGPVTKKSFFRVLAESATDAREKYYLMFLCSRAGADEFQALRLQAPNVLELLRVFPSCKLSLAQLLDNSFPLAPRFYSVASSPLRTPNPTFAFNVFRFSTVAPYNQSQEGLCTSWLERFCDPFCQKREQGRVAVPSSPTIPVFLKPSTDFALPADGSVPIVMIGPGTGVAPFVGFLEQRRGLKSKQQVADFGPAWLFYGCRDREKDFLFREELEGFERDGTLTKLVVAYSREETTTETTKYVQHLMKTHGGELCQLLLSQNTRIFVCG